MLTMHELTNIEEKCRYRLKKQGLKLEKKRYSNGLYYNPANARYRINAGEQSGSDYPLRIEGVMQAAGIA